MGCQHTARFRSILLPHHFIHVWYHRALPEGQGTAVGPAPDSMLFRTLPDFWLWTFPSGKESVGPRRHVHLETMSPFLDHIQ